MEPKLSIIMPCFNCEKTLAQAINSCFVQGFDVDSFEIVMVDDSSTDSTRDVMSTLAKKYKNISCLYHEKNQGGGAARNTAVKNSKAEVIFCLDSDDILPKGTMRKMYDYLKEKNCDGVTIHMSIKFIGDDINKIEYIDVSDFVDKQIPLISLIQKRFCPVYVNFMYTKDAFNKANGYPTIHGFDTQGYAWRFICSGAKVFTCPKAEYLHRVHFNKSYYQREYNDGKSNYNLRTILLEHYYIFNKKVLDFICNYDCSDFTENIMDILANMEDVFVKDPDSEFSKSHTPLQKSFPSPVYINRNSIKGYYLRIRRRLIKILTTRKNK